jgi:chemotaxis protein methyltransferase CheR
MALRPPTDGPSMTEAEFRSYQELIRTSCGLFYAPDSKYLMEKRVARRMQAVEMNTFAAYRQDLQGRGDGEKELSLLIDELTTNETYFFRERKQLRALAEEIVPELLERNRAEGKGPVRIWSAGCSSGEEPYSIVMLCEEQGMEAGKDFHVYGSDICRPVLQKARRGIYRQSAFRETESELVKKYFEEKDGLFHLSDAIKKKVDFIHLNFLDMERTALLGTMDVILCRNVIIYFNPETKKRVINTFFEKLNSGGYLLLGHAESLINLSTDFRLCHLKNDLVYVRPIPGEGKDDLWDIAAKAAIDRRRGDR